MKYYIILLSLYSIINGQEFSWYQINEIDEGWQYIISTNISNTVIAAGIDLEDDNPFKIYYY